MHTETFVPKPLRLPGWSKDYRRDEHPWSPEREAFSMLFSPFKPPQGVSIEYAICTFREWVAEEPSLATAGWFSRWLARNDAPCEHRVQRRFVRCGACDGRYLECVAYLERLKLEVQAFYRSHEYWLSLDPYEFEAEVAKLFRDTGLEAEVTRGSGDGGVDVFVRRHGVSIVVQCKQHRRPVGPAVARELLGAMALQGAQRAILICTGGFTEGVRKLAEGEVLRLYDLDGLVELRRAADAGARAH